MNSATQRDSKPATESNRKTATRIIAISVYVLVLAKRGNCLKKA